MKRLYIILTALVAFAFAPAAFAQYTIADFINGKYPGKTLTFPKDFGVQFPEGKNFAYSKNISSPFSDGTYYIKLESFATGAASIEDTPSDIVLVLDVSGSMRENYGSESGWFPRARNNQYGWCYSDDYSTYYYKVGENQYEKVYHLRTGTSNSNYRYFLYYDHNGTRYWLWQDGVQTTQPTGATAQGSSQAGGIYWGVLWAQKHKAKIDELKDAVKDFIEIIQDNDKYFTDKNGNKVLRTDEDGNPKPLGNKISLVKFAYQAYYNANNLLQEGNHRGPNGSNNYNYSELVKNLTLVDDAGKAALDAAIDSFIEGGTTASDYGLNIGNSVLGTITRESNRTVVLFTDGTPTRNSNFEEAVANAAINYANTAKTTYKATVFAVGVFDTETNNIRTYMNRVSSNYTGATSMTNTGARQVSTDYYFNAKNGNLREVFANIAHKSGGSQSTLSASTSNVDIVSNSFILPAGVTSTNIANYVKVFTAPLTYCDPETNTYTFGTETLAGHATDTYDVYDDGGNVIGTYKVDEVPNPSGTGTVGISVALENGNAIKVTNFDYSNNWCGPVEDQAHQITYHGHKIIILIPIQMNPDAVGGPNVETNAEGSGIFTSPTESYVTFKSPTVSLPVNIYIEKVGLTGVESAKFMIERAVIPDKEDWTVADIADDAWEYVSTVFVTNSPNSKKTADGNPVTRVVGLPATKSVNGVQKGLVYRVSEENWSWSYVPGSEPQHTDTEHMENPFTFSNSKPDARIDLLIKHSESKVTNVFKEGVQNTVYDDYKTNNRQQQQQP